MIIKPIIPIWLMSIICLIIIFLILFDKPFKEKISNKIGNEKTDRQKELIKKQIISSGIKILIVILMFIINLRFMIPNGESTALSSDLSVLFVVDTSVSMRALDYNGNKERMEGVINDCCYIIDELSGSKYSIITFGDTAQRVIPFTTDSVMAQAEIKAIKLENDSYAKGTSINVVKEVLKKTLEDEQKRQNGDTKFVVFFITDGEITKEGERLSSFSEMKTYISDGAVLGYGTIDGGKMINSSYVDNPDSDYYYKYYYDNNYKRITALSKLDEKNLKQISADLGIDYIQMNKQDNINDKLKSIREQIINSQSAGDKIKSYQDIYFYFAIPLVILLTINFIIQKRRI